MDSLNTPSSNKQSETLNSLFWINNKEAYCYDRTVTLHAEVDNAVSMRFSPDNATWTSWGNYTTSMQYPLAYANGQHNVYGEFQYSDGSIIALSASIYFIDKIFMSNGATGDLLGNSVALSADGMRVIAGMPGYSNFSGGVVVCDWNGLTWSKTILTPSSLNAGEECGFSVACSGDGMWIAAGSPYRKYGTLANCGRVYVFHYTGSAWTEYDLDISLPSGGEEMGFSVALHYDSNSSIRIAAGACMAQGGAGAVYFWQWNGSLWSQGQLISGVSTSRLGSSVTFSQDGLTCAAGAPQYDSGLTLKAGAVYIYSLTGPSWSLVQSRTAPDLHEDYQFGNAVSLSSNGTILLAGSRMTGTPTYGEGYLFTNGGSGYNPSYTFMPTLLTSDIQFGSSVSLSGDGAQSLIGAPRYPDSSGHLAGKVFLYLGSGSSWPSLPSSVFSAADHAGDDLFGYAAALSSDSSTIAIGAPGNATFGNPASGSIYIIRQ